MNRGSLVAVANYSKIKLYLLVDSLAKLLETTVTSGPIKVIENERRVGVLLRTTGRTRTVYLLYTQQKMLVTRQVN